MGSLFRSEEMCRCQLFLQTEAAYACVAELGELGLVQFRDLNPDVNAFQRKFVNEVRRCDEMERMLRFLEKEIKKDRIPILDTGENPDAPQPREMIDLEATFEKLDNEMREVNTNEEMLKKNFLELTELKHILRKTQAFFEEHEDMQAIQTLHADRYGHTNLALEADGEMAINPLQQNFDKLNLQFVAGVILRERLPSFERMLWRACRGNVFLKQAEIGEPLEDPVTGDYVQKCVVIIFFQGEQLKTRVKKICEGFRATLYPCPETSQERREMALGVMTRIEDLKTVLSQTQDHRHRVLMAAAKNIRIWFTKVRKIKAIYHTLNLFNLDVTQKCLIAECWCPVSDLDKIQLALKRGTEESGSSIPSILNRMECSDAPPTYNRTNKFTAGFQGIVDAYGVPNYREVNPTPYTIVTFPFLFAVMFGDMGHGLLMFFFALFLVLKEKQLAARKIKDEIFNIFFGGRYIILLMGVFSIYTGFVYNELYSKSMNVFGSSWKSPYNSSSVPEGLEKLQLSPNNASLNHSYPYGFDPIWSLAENKLNFLNSFKMKMSIILGVVQMFFGVLLSLVNFRFFNKPLDIYGVFIPELLFMACIFLYLCIMICYKWVAFSVFPAEFPALNSTYPGSHCAPSLLIGLIDMFMFSKRKIGFGGNCPPDPQFYPHQAGFEGFLVVVALLCIPVMLLYKPVMLYRQNKQRSLLRTMNIVEALLVVVAVACVPWMLILKPVGLYLTSRPPKETSTCDRMSVHADMKAGDAEVVYSEIKDDSQAPDRSVSVETRPDPKEFDVFEVSILQAIHTIEYCLGCVSHTASYLRLWALSLAHAQLSEVLWSMVMSIPFSIDGYLGAIVAYLIFWAFGCLTIGVLVLMEGLSAFLHALRLHWVEFQSKFYEGSGYPFAPFSFDHLLEQTRVEEGD